MTALVEVQRDPALEEMENNRVKRRARINRPRWNPKQWHPVYEEIVLLDALGYKNIAIAEEKGFTKEHISNILNTPQAKTIKQIILKRMEKKRDETIDQRLERLANRAMDRVEEVIENDKFATKNPGGMFDRALALLKGTNKVKDPDKNVTNNNTLILTEASMKMMTKAISLSDHAKALHSGTDMDEEAVDLRPKEEIEVSARTDS